MAESDIIADILNIIMTTTLASYEGLLGQLLHDSLTFIVNVIMLQMIARFILSVFPFLQRLADLIFAPFSFLHKWSHVHKAKQINAHALHSRLRKVDREEMSPAERYFSNKMLLRSSFSLGVGDRENATLSLMSMDELSLKEAIAILQAPSKYGIYFTLLLFFTAPLTTYHKFFLLLHFYFFFGSLLYLFPSTEDLRFMVNSILTTSTVSPMYILHGVTIFIAASIIGYHYYLEIGLPPYWYLEIIKKGLFAATTYFTGLFGIIVLTKGDLSLKPQLDSLVVGKEVSRWKEQRSLENLHLRSPTPADVDTQLLQVLVQDEESEIQ
ncbi:MAG TPA: hypothetical protein VJ044_16260 [Candidatus Hodarchaeales archaeon]|nr:hypothetical protein [Candidatus Hodarchaeales archaeon]